MSHARGPALVHDAVGGGDVDLGRVADEPVAGEDLAGLVHAHARAASRALRIVAALTATTESRDGDRDRLRRRDRCARRYDGRVRTA